MSMWERLQRRETGGGRVEQIGERAWRLSLPAGPAGMYRWAQLDDYLHLPRRAFAWQTPFRIELNMRVSAPNLPGTWGFGVWNDPFSLSLGLGGAARRIPALPQATWFFHASLPNHLALHDDHPAQGFLAATFRSAPMPAGLLALGGLALPLLALRPPARLLRRLARRFVSESAVLIETNVTEWHSYRISRQEDWVKFGLDRNHIASTSIAPRFPLGLVIWIDNQYAAFPPDGRVKMGTLTNPECWLEVELPADVEDEKGRPV